MPQALVPVREQRARGKNFEIRTNELLDAGIIECMQDLEECATAAKSEKVTIAVLKLGGTEGRS